MRSVDEYPALSQIGIRAASSVIILVRQRGRGKPWPPRHWCLVPGGVRPPAPHQASSRAPQGGSGGGETQAATRSGLDAAAAELPRERFPADEDALGLQYEPPERGATVADNEHRREDLREHFKEAVFARCTVPWRRTHRIASPPCPLQRGRRSATSSRPSRACARLACSTSRPSAGPLSRTTSTGARTCASTSRRQWRLPLYLNLSAHVLARMTSSQSCSTYPIEGRWVGWVEIGSTCARERGKAPRRPPRRRGHRRSPREGQNQRYQGQHNLVRCRRRPLVECALVVYLRDPSFEVHGSLPHRYAKVPPRQ